MTITNQQVKLLMKKIKNNTQEVAAAKSGMSVKTARKYLKSPESAQPTHHRAGRTRANPFEQDWPEVASMLENAPGLQAKTIMDYLLRKKPSCYKPGHLRTLQRHIQQWRSEYGKNSAVIFNQVIQPGIQSQSDFTCMNELHITINGQYFKHILFHFMLPYSRWESIAICFSETFDNLIHGFEKAVWELGCVAPEHRTDNLSAAVKNMGSRKLFTERWQQFMAHYGVEPTTNNPGQSHENGSVEKSHDTLKTAIEQHLLLRGHRNFSTQQEYKEFLEDIVKSRNDYRQERLVHEMDLLKELPDNKWNAPQILQVRVSPGSIVSILGQVYSVPSRLISYSLKAYVYPHEIILFYGSKKLQVMRRAHAGDPPVIDYRHIIDSLIRKPHAFAHYKYHEALFPRQCFRDAYDYLNKSHRISADKQYLKLLHLAKIESEQLVAMAIELLLEASVPPTEKCVKELIDTYHQERQSVTVNQPNLKQYDSLLVSQPSSKTVEVTH